MKICIPIVSSDLSEIIDKIRESAPKSDIIEVWLGELFSSPETSRENHTPELFEQKIESILEPLFVAKKEAGNIPFLMNVKDAAEKGNFTGTEEEKVLLLKKASEYGAEYVDIDFQCNPDFLSQLKKTTQDNPTQLILSAHFFDGTPTFPALKNRVQRMKNSGADIVKIATMPESEKDLITILRFSENMKRKNIPFIAMSMGAIGKISRLLTPLLGGEMMFAPLSKEEASAPGQICRDELCMLESIFSWKE